MVLQMSKIAVFVSCDCLRVSIASRLLPGSSRVVEFLRSGVSIFDTCLKIARSEKWYMTLDHFFLIYHLNGRALFFAT